jgi:hypothetical protein
MRNEKVGDTVYWEPTKKSSGFILEPYFVKQKALYEKKTFYDNNSTHSRYTCKEVTLLKKSQVEQYVRVQEDKYVICYIFISDNGNESRFSVNPIDPPVNYPKKFISEKEFIKQQQSNKEDIQRQEQAIKEQEERNKKEEQMRKSQNDAAVAKQEEKDKAKYAEYVKKYGQANADLIIKRKVVIGMTQEMCIYSWGPFYKPSKVVNDQGTFETWYYSPTSFLYFVNGILKEIKQ